ncbi:MAG: molybdenum cofactor guanylyltransferase [Verrucomicrobiota bacterium]
MRREMLGLILCGGKSGRMGQDKGELKLRGERTQLEYSIGMLQKLCSRVVVSVGPKGSSRRELPEGVEIVEDVAGVEGPMGGVLAGLRVASALPVMVIAVDMPYLEISHLVQLANRRDEEKQATAFVAEDGFADPMCAIYEPACLPLIEERASLGRFGLRRLLEAADLERIALDRPFWLASVNDPDALRKARDELSGQAD